MSVYQTNTRTERFVPCHLISSVGWSLVEEMREAGWYLADCKNGYGHTDDGTFYGTWYYFVR